MKVTIPATPQHEGYPGNLVTITISDYCPKCGEKRGPVSPNGISYDGSRRLHCDTWSNPCGHNDRYREAIAEYLRAKRFEHKTRGGTREECYGCGKMKVCRPHECGYESEIHNKTKSCNCCKACQRNCNDNI